MIQFIMRNDGREFDLRLRINIPMLIRFLKRLTALISALTALAGAIIQLGAMLGWW